MELIGRRWLMERDFGGFVSVESLRATDLAQVPDAPGVYAVLREVLAPPLFLQQNPGGHFKGNDPTVAVEALKAAWNSNSQILYLGKTGDSRGRTLRRRLSEYVAFGAGEPIGHWGGRYAWQLGAANSSLVAWREAHGDTPLSLKRELLAEHRQVAGRLPFANLREG